jgi:hypothetical protein
LEERLLGRRRASELALVELREVAGQEVGPDGVGVRPGAEGPGDGGRAAGVGRRREGDHRREELFRQALDVAGGRLRLHGMWIARCFPATTRKLPARHAHGTCRISPTYETRAFNERAKLAA